MWGNHCHKMQNSDYLEDKVRGRFLARDTQASRTVSMFSNYNCMGSFISLYWFIKPLFIKLNWGTFLYMCHIFFLKEDDKGKMNVWVTEWLIYIFHTHMKYIQWAPNYMTEPQYKADFSVLQKAFTFLPTPQWLPPPLFSRNWLFRPLTGNKVNMPHMKCLTTIPVLFFRLSHVYALSSSLWLGTKNPLDTLLFIRSNRECKCES